MEHHKPLLKIHLDRCVLIGDPVGFRCEVGIFKHENSANGDIHATKRCLSESTPRRSIEEYLGPRFSINLHGGLKCDRRVCGFVCPDGVIHNGLEVSMAILERLTTYR